MRVRFTWDRAKAERNQRAHGISFPMAAEIFDDPNHVVGNNYFIESDGEQRYQAIGMTRKLVLLVVVFVDRSQPDTDVIHLISARKAVDYENSIYNDQFR
ncbi:MAG: BrnT family toxin [Acidobacteria bacterium]|nr:BrnT family toxin [Acidobacteriota bacterium]